MRVELEADIEYLMVEAVWQIYQVTGDIEWVKKVLPALEKGINYMTSDPRRFDKEHGLCIRPFTIDTWDFVYDLSTPRPKDIRNICPGVTPMSIMHGDNSGIFAAMKKLSAINGIIGNSSAANDWGNRAEKSEKTLINTVGTETSILIRYILIISLPRKRMRKTGFRSQTHTT